MKITDVLVPIDFSLGSMKALDFAISLIEPEGEIYLLHVIDSDFVARLNEEGFGEAEKIIEQLRAKAEERMQAIKQASTELSQSLETMVVVGKPFSEILRVADDLDFSLIMIGVHGKHQNDIEELLFGSTAEKVLRGARIPVVCVPPTWSKG